jgi:ABC-2 type transport system ATP-binding protein
MSPPVLAVDSLRRAWAGRPALASLSLELGAGGTLGLIGPDGAGKTTAMRIVCGLLRPDGGSARVLGLDCATQTARIRPLLGYMPQRFSLYPDLSVDENLRFFAELHGLPAARWRRRRERLLAFARLEPFTRRRAGALSGGMKQKLALACTLLHEPRLLILDEPTTGVDPVSRQEFWHLLGELAGQGMALWVSTPAMDEAARCDRIQLLHQGHVLADGPPASVASAVRRRLLVVAGGGGRLIERGFSRLELGDVRRVGNDLRLACDTEQQVEEARRFAQTQGLTALPSPPGLEDAFFELTSQGREAA